MLRDRRVVDDDAVRATPLEADQVAPVVEHPKLLPRHDRDDALVSVAGRHERHVMRRVRNARAEVPGAVDAVAAVDALRARVLKREARRSDEVPIREELVLCGLREVRGNLQGVGRPQSEHPAGRGAAARDRRHHPVERGQVELQPSVAARDEDPIEARLLERFVQLLRVVAPLLGRRLLREQPGAKRVRPRDHLIGCRSRRVRDVRHPAPSEGFGGAGAILG